MIRTEAEYQEAVQRLEAERKRLKKHEYRLKQTGLTAAQLKRALDPLKSFHLQLAEEVKSYERLKRGDIGELTNLHGLGRVLVAARIALGLTQRELSKRLAVDESQISRDERNDYHGITVDRASRILDALGVEALTEFMLRPAKRQLEEFPCDGGSAATTLNTSPTRRLVPKTFVDILYSAGIKSSLPSIKSRTVALANLS